MIRKLPYSRRGVTLIEISFVTAIAAVMMAMILGLAQHISAISDIRRAQTDLATWHQAMDNWHDTFGEYPGDIIRENGARDSPLDGETLGNLSNVYYKASQFFYDNTSIAEVKFETYCTQPVKISDPWKTPYIYLRDEGRQSYKLFSCGPDARTPDLGDEERTGYDDIYFGK